jgi:hypothetical protein
MALTETKEIDKIEIVSNGVIQVREATTIFKDDEYVARSYRRWCFAPGADVSEMPQNVKDIAKTTWTKQVIDGYKASLVDPLDALIK